MGTTYHRQGQCGESLPGSFKKYTRVFPFLLLFLFIQILAIGAAAAESPEDLDGRGLAAFSEGEYSLALQSFDGAIALDPAFLPARVHKAMTLLSLDRPGEALLSLEIVLDRDPENVHAWIYRGDALIKLGRNAEAAESFRAAERLDPGNPLIAQRIREFSEAGGGAGMPVLPDLLLPAGAGIGAACILSAVLVMRRKKTPVASIGQEDNDPVNASLEGANPWDPGYRERDEGGDRRGISLSLLWHRPGAGRKNEKETHSSALRGAGSRDGKDRRGFRSPARILSLFSGKRGQASGKGVAPPAGTKAIGSHGPLDQTDGGEIPAGGRDEERDSPDPGRIVSGFDRILGEAGIDPSGLKGIALYAMGRNEEALLAFRREQEDPDAYPGVVPLEATVLLKLGRPEEALLVCENAIRNGKGTFEIYRVQSAILERLGRFEETICACDEALVKNPHSVDIWSLRARALFALQRDHEALQSCDRALSMDPHSPEIVQQKARILARLGRTDDALAVLDRGIPNHPREMELLLEKARILALSDRLRDAIATVDAALAISPADHRAWKELATILHRIGEYAEEAAAWERASTLSPANLEYLVSWANALMDAGEFLPAARALLRALKMNPEDLHLWKALGRSLYKARRYEDAVRAFRHITGKAPDDGEAWKCLGWAYLLAGMVEEARESLIRAYELLPRDREVPEGLRRAGAFPQGGLEDGDGSLTQSHPEESGEKAPEARGECVQEPEKPRNTPLFRSPPDFSRHAILDQRFHAGDEKAMKVERRLP